MRRRRRERADLRDGHGVLDIQRARGPGFFVYPDYYLFQVGRPLGDHARLDVVEAILDPEGRLERLRTQGGNGALVAAVERRMGEVERAVRARILEARRGLREDGRPVETYRRLGLEEALALLAASAQRQQ